ncbi:MAG: AMP-binding protein [Chitinophagales bacterium]
MKELIQDIYCCPITKASYEHQSLNSKNTGMLYCKTSNTYVPIINNIIYFNERSIYISDEDCLEAVDQLAQQCAAYSFEYSEFVKQKNRRAYNDAYAAFQPFNEASKAFYPFIQGIKEQLQPGDIILDIWNRTGWSTFFLAALFPEQSVISIWDKNKDVLGYKGYNFWFAQQDIPENISVIFADLNDPLPFKDDSIALTYAMDTLHWFPQATYLPELLRIIQSNGINLFPHVHMANNAPEPFFERGGLQLHGEVYQKIFDNLLPQYHKKGYIFSEPDLFQLEDSRIMESDPATNDYNGCLAIFPQTYKTPLQPFQLDDTIVPKSRIIINPFLKINSVLSIVEIDREHFEGSVGHIMDRHPVYDKMLSKNDGYKLSDRAVKVLYYGSKGRTLEEIAILLNEPLSDLITETQLLQSKDIIELLPISETGFRLQHFHSTQDYIAPKEYQTLCALWRDAVVRFNKQTALISEFDESELTYEELAEIVDIISQRFIQNGLEKGDKIAVYAPISPESTMLFWAAMQVGLVYIPISHLMPSSQLSSIAKEYDIKIFFTDQPLDINTENILLDSFEASSTLKFFSEWLDPESLSEDFEFPIIHPEDEAVILFTSGSTGRPKGVIHSHGALFRSGRLITENFQWTADDGYLATADLDSMSGLRNCVIAPLHVGASIILPNVEQRAHAVAISELINKRQVSIISTTPTLLRQWLLMGRRIRASLSTVKFVMCTGSNLSEELINEFEVTFKIPVINYYGLTETCGICIAVNRTDIGYSKSTIGKAKGAIVQIVDDNNEILPYGVEGNLRILTENCFKGYFNQPEAYDKIVQNNWLYTGDTATIAEDGWVYLKGRKRDIVKNVRGDLIYPIEIETFILQNENVKDAHVCAHIQEDMEYLIAFIVLHTTDTENSTKKAILNDIEVSLGKGKLPKFIKIVQELPYNTNGKVNRSKLLADQL